MESLARVFLGLIAIAMLLALARGGWPGLKAWLHAKFIGA